MCGVEVIFAAAHLAVSIRLEGGDTIEGVVIAVFISTGATQFSLIDLAATPDTAATVRYRVYSPWRTSGLPSSSGS